MKNNKEGASPEKTEKKEPPKTIVVPRQRLFLFKGRGIWPFKRSPKPHEVDPIINTWMESMAKNGQPVQLGKYLSSNGDLVFLFLYNERVPID